MRWTTLVPVAAVAALALPAAAAAKLPPPRLLGPANGARYQELPAISWASVRGAAEYEYEISADPHFHSILGSGPGQGTSKTHNLAATLDKVVADGRYSWRVRAVTARGAAGAWSRERTIIKHWTATPRITGGDGVTISWPSTPLRLQWSSAPYAVKYIVSIATDPGLSNQILGTPASPQYTDGTSFVLPTTLANGTYYWAVTPVDAESHRGVRSRVGSFTWSWPTSTNSWFTNLSGGPGVFDPLFSWNLIPGAARYDVEINASPTFAPGSKWCCSTPTIGTSLAPQLNLANDSTYWWRVRALDENGHAGQWNYPPAPYTSFTEAFDASGPTIPNLTVRDVHGSALSGLPSTDTPIVTWSPVTGAARYEIDVAYWNGSYCNWGSSSLYHAQTASTGWTPLGQNGISVPGPTAWPHPQHDTVPVPPGFTYCVRVLARADDDAQFQQVVSAWTYVNPADDPNTPSFTYLSHSVSGQTFAPFVTPAGTVNQPSPDYILPQIGTATPRTPILTWNWTSGAQGYFVVISRDPAFTDVADVAFTNIPAYAPRLGNAEPLADKSTAYYWAVIPAQQQTPGSWSFNDAVVCSYNGQTDCDYPSSFNKSSVAPSPVAPGNGANVSTWPSFEWTPAENARNYTLQVSEDPSFGNPIDNVTTDGTAYTSSSTYPADVTLYWRVRGNDWVGQGLNWSPVQTFTRRLPVPVPAAGNPASGELEPVWSWTPVPGAVAYDVHVDEANGFTQDWTVDSNAVAPTFRYGIGTIFWQVRALFPTALGSNTVGGGFFARQPYLLTLAPPKGARAVKSGARLVISWTPDPAAKTYTVEVSNTDTFSTYLAFRRVDGTSSAPDINYSLPMARGTLYWRVAAVSSDGITVGAYASGSMHPPGRATHRKKTKKKHH